MGGGIEKVAEMMDLSSSNRWTIVQEVIQAIAQVRTLERGFKLTQEAHPHSPLNTPLEQHHPTQIVC